MSISFVFFLKVIEDGKFRYFWAHGNGTLRDRSKFVCNGNDIAKFKENLNKNKIEKPAKEIESAQDGDSNCWQTQQCLLFYSKICLWLAEMQFHQNNFWRMEVNCLTFEKNTRQPHTDKLSLQKFCSPFAWQQQSSRANLKNFQFISPESKAANLFKLNESIWTIFEWFKSFFAWTFLVLN